MIVEHLHAMAPATKAGFLRSCETAKTAWPGLNISPEEFHTFLFGHSVDVAALTPELLQDLFLACACARDAPGALQHFRNEYGPVVAMAVRRFDESPAFFEDVYQRLSESLFVVGELGRGAKIRCYSGKGSLSGFVATAAIRIALRMASGKARFVGEDALVNHFSQSHHEAELSIMRSRHRDTFNQALSFAVRQLPRRERLVLRMNLVERVSTTRIAAMYNVSQPTVSRWIQRAASNIFAIVKELVCDELEIDTRELESLLILVRSQIEITISHSITVLPSQD